MLLELQLGAWRVPCLIHFLGRWQAEASGFTSYLQHCTCCRHRRSLQVGKMGADVLFRDPAVKSTSVGVTVYPVTISSLEEFGDLEAVGRRLLDAGAAPAQCAPPPNRSAFQDISVHPLLVPVVLVGRRGSEFRERLSEPLSKAVYHSSEISQLCHRLLLEQGELNSVC